MSKKKVAILMATYNGENYLKEQIKSIREQTFKNWQLYIRDDGSTDATVSILREVSILDDRINIIHDDLGNIGVKSGFMVLLRNVNAQYYFFSDQDDVWLPNKLNDTLKEFRIEDYAIPTLVHTNLTIVDSHLNVLNKYFYPAKIDLDRLTTLVISNSVAGCTVAINDILKQQIIDDPVDAMVMHDWWMALYAAIAGKIYYVNSPTILYRQHSTNQEGADASLVNKISRIVNYSTERQRVIESFKQIELMISLHGSDMRLDIKKMLLDYSLLLTNNRFMRCRLMFRYNFRKRSLLGTLSLWRIILIMKKIDRNE